MYTITVYGRIVNGQLIEMTSGHGTLKGCFRKAKEYPDQYYRVVIRRKDSERRMVRCGTIWCHW